MFPAETRVLVVDDMKVMRTLVKGQLRNLQLMNITEAENGDEAFKTLQYAKHVYDVPGHLTAPAFAFFINKRKWNSISAKDRDAIMKLGGEALSARFSAYDIIEMKTRADAAARGITIQQASPAFLEELRKLAAPLEAAWLADAASLGVDGKAALQFFKDEAVKNAK